MRIELEKKKKQLSKKIISFVIASIFIFTAVAIFIQYKTGMELSPTLTTCFFSFCTGELWCLSSIKKTKIKNSSGYTVLNQGEEEGAKG